MNQHSLLAAAVISSACRLAFHDSLSTQHKQAVLSYLPLSVRTLAATGHAMSSMQATQQTASAGARGSARVS